MYSFPDLEPICCSMSSSNCCFLTRIKISQETGNVVWYSHLLKNFPVCYEIYTVKDFNVINEAEVDFFLEFSCLFYDPTKIMASSPITSWQIDGETVETVADFILGGSKITADADCSHEIKILAPGKKSYDKPRQHIKKQRHYFANKGPSSRRYSFSSSHVQMLRVGP